MGGKALDRFFGRLHAKRIQIERSCVDSASTNAAGRQAMSEAFWLCRTALSSVPPFYSKGGAEGVFR